MKKCRICKKDLEPDDKERICLPFHPDAHHHCWEDEFI